MNKTIIAEVDNPVPGNAACTVSPRPHTSPTELIGQFSDCLYSTYLVFQVGYIRNTARVASTPCSVACSSLRLALCAAFYGDNTLTLPCRLTDTVLRSILMMSYPVSVVKPYFLSQGFHFLCKRFGLSRERHHACSYVSSNT
jgi:hypothetical protein